MPTTQIVRGPGVVDQFELTPMQHGMLFESVFSNRPWLNVEQIVIRMDEELDPDAFQQAWRSVQKRHAALRTSFRWEGLPLPIQEVHLEAPLNYQVDDWRSVSTAAQETQLEAFIEADRQAGVQLDEPASMRIHLFRCSDVSWTLVWTFHHATLDGRGLTLILEEVFRVYEGTRSGDRPAQLPITTMRPHLEALRDRDTDAAETFFRELLQGCERTRLPIERSGLGKQRQREFAGSMSAEVIRGLERLSTDAGATLYTCLQAGWAITLAKYSGAGDVVFGSTRSGRHTFPEAMETAGCFINTLPVRANVGDEDSVGDLLRVLREQSIGLRDHEHTPLVDIQRWCGNAGEALLTSNIVYERYYLDARLRANGGSWENRHTKLLEQGSIPLTLALYLGDDGLEVCFEYDSSLYDEAAINRLHRHFAAVISHLALAEPATRIGSISLLDDEEHEQLRTFGRPANPIQRDGTTYVDVFTAQVERAPNAIALRRVDSSDTLTYAELNQRSNNLAHKLREQGVGAGERVAVCLPRSFELAAAILGVLKAGAAYVPLDPRYPSSALAHMLEDSAARVVLTNKDSTHAVLFSERNTLFIDELSANADSTLLDLGPALSLTDSDPAYIIYTSGSTGTPKGVVVSHGALVAHNRAVASLFELETKDRCLQFASFSFDVAVEEMMSTWLAGATLVFRNQAMSESVSGFLKETERSAITVLNIPTAFWHELVIQMERRSLALPSSVRLVVVGGEKASRKAHTRWAKLVPGVRWLNGYGPTEATVTCTTFDALAEQLDDDRELPIGRPTRNATVYVLDAQNRPVPIGVFGQLFIGGASVADGYLGAPETTAARFVDDVTFAGERVYASGDLCRWLPSGLLEFAGRADRQLKARGFRIEPGEIETALETLENVDEALVALFEETRLVAWLRASEHLDVAELRRQLRALLPPHMVPSAYMCMEDFPRTSGGKVDRAQLPAPALAENTSRGEPRHATDRTLCALFAEALDVWNVRVNDSFFDLGGQSLIAIRLLDRIEDELGTRPSLAALRMSPTPAELADWITNKSDDDEDWEYIYPIQAKGSKPPFFAIHVLGSNGALFAPLSKCLGPDQPVVGLAVALRDEGVGTDVVEVASGYVDEIMRYAPEGPIAMGAVSLGGLVAFEVAHELRARGREVGLIALFDALAPGSLQSVSRLERVRLHAGEFVRRGGMPYLREKAASRLRRVRELFERTQLRVKRTLGYSVRRRTSSIRRHTRRALWDGAHTPTTWMSSTSLAIICRCCCRRMLQPSPNTSKLHFTAYTATERALFRAPKIITARRATSMAVPKRKPDHSPLRNAS